MTVLTGPRALTEREIEILTAVAGGTTHTEIARSLNVTRNTVESHLARIRAALSARNTAHAVAIAITKGHI